jgi:hypothetical protein
MPVTSVSAGWAIVTLRLVYLIFLRLSSWAALLVRSAASKDAEILLLRHQLTVVRRRSRPRPSWADRAIISALARLLPNQRRRHLFVTPGMLLRWHADLIKRRWTVKRRRPGRPPMRPPIRAVILRMAQENLGWGYRRVAGELAGMGRQVGASTVWAILKRAEIDPCPRRSGPTWGEFLRAQAEGILACDISIATPCYSPDCTVSRWSSTRPVGYISSVSLGDIKVIRRDHSVE